MAEGKGYYIIHIAMNPVLHVEVCRTRPGSITHWYLSPLGHCDFPPVICSFCFLWYQNCSRLAFFQSLFYCLVFRSPRLKASLPCAVLTDSGSRFHLSNNSHRQRIFSNICAQCCGSGSGIRCLFDPGPGSGIRNRFFPDL
jgi:hypothetical protein